MPTAIACPKCNKKYSLPDNMLGKPIKCPACGAAFKVGVAAAQAASARAPLSRTASRAAAAFDPSELASKGLGGPIMPEPDLFGDVPPPQAGNPLGNHVVVDPGFAEVGYSAEVEEEVDPMQSMFQNPALPGGTSSGKSKGARKTYRGDPNYSYGSLGIWAILVTIGICIFSAVTVGLIGYASYQLSNLPGEAEIAAAVEAAEAAEEAGEEFEIDPAMQDDFFSIVLRLLGLVIALALSYLFAAAMVMVFMYRANCNVRALGAKGLKISPGGSVGWWFCPFLNLWKPVESMGEIYKASIKPDGATWKKVADPSSVGLWWMCFILNGLPSKIGDWCGAGPTMQMVLLGIGILMFLVSGGLLIKIVFSISRLQSEHAAQRGLA